MSAAAVEIPEVDRYTRFRQLLTWLEGLGTCACCRVGMALERVELEMGDRDFKAVALPCRMPAPCRDLANAARTTMPKRAP